MSNPYDGEYGSAIPGPSGSSKWSSGSGNARALSLSQVDPMAPPPHPVEEVEIPDVGIRGTGRYVQHDPRSRAHEADLLAKEELLPRFWARAVPVFDQLRLGSCTGQASVGCIGTGGFFATLPEELQRQLLTETGSGIPVQVYSQATHVDHYRGIYPPTDTGSSGLAVAKVLYKMALIRGYKHAFSLRGVLSAIQWGPIIGGINWYGGFYYPDPTTGLVDFPLQGREQVYGGHELCFDEFRRHDAGDDPFFDDNELWATNSWGTSFALQGRFGFKLSAIKRLQAERADFTSFLPL